MALLFVILLIVVITFNVKYNNVKSSLKESDELIKKINEDIENPKKKKSLVQQELYFKKKELIQKEEDERKVKDQLDKA